jgi:peptide/nickel transport system substrate-binding protein
MALLLAVLLLGATPVMAGESPTRGGTLRFAMIDTPPSLDAHVLTATLSTTVSQHFLETLFAFTDQYEAVPHLARARRCGTEASSSSSSCAKECSSTTARR